MSNFQLVSLAFFVKLAPMVLLLACVAWGLFHAYGKAISPQLTLIRHDWIVEESESWSRTQQALWLWDSAIQRTLRPPVSAVIMYVKRAEQSPLSSGWPSSHQAPYCITPKGQAR